MNLHKDADSAYRISKRVETVLVWEHLLHEKYDAVAHASVFRTFSNESLYFFTPWL